MISKTPNARGVDINTIGDHFESLMVVLIATLMNPQSFHLMDPLDLRVNGASLHVNGASWFSG